MVQMHQGTSAGVPAHGVCCLLVIGSTAPGHDITLFPHLISVCATDVPANLFICIQIQGWRHIFIDTYSDFDVRHTGLLVGFYQAGRNRNRERVMLKIQDWTHS